MPNTHEKVVLENDRLKVSRVTLEAGAHKKLTSRGDRLVIYLHDARVVRTEGERREDILRKAGDVAWRPQSQHEVDAVGQDTCDVLIVELK